MTAYYNENDPHAAEVLRQLISHGAIAPGVVDERDIRDVKPRDLDPYTQCHFFAGIGGWSKALRLSGWADNRRVWTGSCPCQPFSEAGIGVGYSDERHLWPHWGHLIEQQQPTVIFGEQVASKAGRQWLDLVQTDLEALEYRTAAADLCAASVGSPQRRQREWFVALADAERERLQRYVYTPAAQDRPQQIGSCIDAMLSGGSPERGPTNGFWRDADWLYCQDERWRPVEPTTLPLANGVRGRVGALSTYGNAIVPQVGQAFIEVVMEELG